MRRACKVVALLLGALVLATASAPASAQSPIEAWHEGGDHCDPCVIHGVGSTSFSYVGSSNCEDEFEAEVYEDAEPMTGLQGYVYSYQSDTMDSFCTGIQCNGIAESVSEVEWPIFDMAETGPGELHFWMRACFDNKNAPFSTGIHCMAEYTLSEVAPHSYEYEITDGCPGWGLTGEGAIESETHDEVEFVHAE